MERLRIIEGDLIKAGFTPDFENYQNKDINVRVPLPRRKINVTTRLAYYGVVEINIDSCEIKTCGLIVERNNRMPNDEELKFNQRKMNKAISKIIDIIQHSRITKDFVIEYLIKANVDEDITKFIKKEFYLEDEEELF